MSKRWVLSSAMKCSVFAIGLIASAFLFCSSVDAQVDDPHTTSGQVVLSSGRKLAYTVEIGRIPIRDGGSDQIRAYMFFVAYRVPSKEPRSVMFLWNGGPGDSSSALHLQSIGPRLISADGTITANADTILGSTDLVFVDAVGTGFSRLAEPAFADEFYQMRGDVASFTEFVRVWRLLYGADRSRIYVAGESWGAFRADAVALALEKRDIKVAGIVAISGRPGLPNGWFDTTLRALRTVQQALAAQFHGKLSPDLPKDPATLQKTVRDWVMSTYVPALEHIGSLNRARRDVIAHQLSAFIGIPDREIDRATLMVYPHQFLVGLLRDKGEVLTTYDMTITTEPKQDIRAVENYLRHDLGYTTGLAYIQDGHELNGFSPDGGPIKNPGDLWDYHKGFFRSPVSASELDKQNELQLAHGEPPRGQETPDSADAMAIDPQLRLMIADGLYDSRSTCASTAEILARQSPALRARIEAHCYKGGHMFYLYPETRRQFSEDLQNFIAAQASH